MGRGRRNKIKAFDPFSKTNGVVPTDDRKYNAPPKSKKKRKHDDNDWEAPKRIGQLLLVPKPGQAAQAGMPSRPKPSKDFEKGGESAPMKRRRAEDSVNSSDVGAGGGPGASSQTAAGSSRPSKPPMLSMLPGETFSRFAQRVNAATRAKLNTDAAKVKGISEQRKAKLASVKQAIKVKRTAAAALSTAKTLVVSSGNAAAIKEMRAKGVDDELVAEVVKRTDTVGFGERVEAPPVMSSKMLAYFDKLKRKSHASAAAHGLPIKR